MRFFIGLVVGAAGAALAHHADQSTTVVCLVGAGLCIAVWCRLFDFIWDVFCAAMGWD